MVHKSFGNSNSFDMKSIVLSSSKSKKEFFGNFISNNMVTLEDITYADKNILEDIELPTKQLNESQSNIAHNHLSSNDITSLTTHGYNKDVYLQKYIQMISQFPFLTPEEESSLFIQAQSGSQEAFESLIKSHLRLVVRIAFEYKRYGLSMMDLISEGNIGLMTAVKKFNSDHGTRLSTYAMLWIRAKIQSFILKSWSLVKIGTSNMERVLFFGLQKIKYKLGIDLSSNMTNAEIENVAKQIGVKAKDVQQIEQRLSNRDSSMDILNEEGFNVYEMSSNSPNPEDIAIHTSEREKIISIIEVAMSTLSSREVDIIKSRILNDSEKAETLESLSKRLGVSSERIRQIGNSALKKLREFLEKNGIMGSF